MFVGREKELKELKERLAKEQLKALIYGCRRVGKTSLIYKALEDYQGIIIDYQCLKQDFTSNEKEFCKRVSTILNNPYLNIPSFEEAFTYLGTLNKKVVVFIDEYSYLKEFSTNLDFVDSIFQRIIDKLPSNVSLILCGSYVGIMKENLKSTNPLFGRFNYYLNLKSFNYLEAREFHKDLPVLEEIPVYLIFGGSSIANINYNPLVSLEKNIENLILRQDGILRNYCEHVILEELKFQENAEKILYSLKNGKKKYVELLKALNLANNGSLARMLKPLVEMELLVKVTPINQKNNPEKTFYTINDNLLRFYYTYVYGNENQILRLGEETYYNNYIKDSLTTFLSLRFESMCNEYITSLIKKGAIKDALDVGKYWYDDPKEKKNGEFDIAIKKLDSYDIYEVKYLNKPMSKDDCLTEESKIKAIKNLNLNKIGFFSLNGFNFKSNDWILIDGKDLYK